MFPWPSDSATGEGWTVLSNFPSQEFPYHNRADQNLDWLGKIICRSFGIYIFFFVTTRIETLEVYLIPVPGLIRGWGCINPGRRWAERKGAHGKILYIAYILVSMLISWAPFMLYKKILHLHIKLYTLGHIKSQCLVLSCFCNTDIYDIADCISNNIIIYYIVYWWYFSVCYCWYM